MERSGPGGKEWAGADWLVVRYIYAYFQDFLFDFLKRFQETERRLKFLINTIFLCLSFFLHWPNFEIKTVN